MKENKNILELYTCIQTEGSKAGIPHILIRTTGCTHRCFFSNSWCDSWYTSIHPEKGLKSIVDVENMIIMNPHITHIMITGGSPTMHPELVNEITSLCKKYNLISTIETEGSHFVKTEHPIDLISLSPKFSNSIPKLGMKTPLGKVVDEKLINQHNKHRLNYNAIKNMLTYHKNYHLKPVWDGRDMNVLKEIEKFIEHFKIPNNKVWLMPAGDTLESLQPNYSKAMELCIERGWNFSSRAHIVAYNDKRGV